MDENSLREKIARVIDPDAFDMSDCDYPIAIARAKLRQNAVYVKADVILDLLPKQEERLTKERDDARYAFERALDPRRWSREMADAWHLNIPDTEAAFAALRKATLSQKDNEP